MLSLEQISAYLNAKPTYCGLRLPIVPETARIKNEISAPQHPIGWGLKAEVEEECVGVGSSPPAPSTYGIDFNAQFLNMTKKAATINPMFPAQKIAVDRKGGSNFYQRSETGDDRKRSSTENTLRAAGLAADQGRRVHPFDFLAQPENSTANQPSSRSRLPKAPESIAVTKTHSSDNWSRNKQFVKTIQNGYECLVCHKTFGRYNSVSYHVTMYHRKPPITCGEAGCDFSTRESRYVHFHRFYRHGIPLPPKIDNSSWGCSFCGLIAKSPTMLTKHYQKHQGLIRQQQAVKNPLNPAGSAGQNEDETTGGHFECPECPKLFESAKFVLRHMVQAHAKTASDLLKRSTAAAAAAAATNLHQRPEEAAAAARSAGMLNKSFQKAKISFMYTNPTTDVEEPRLENNHQFPYRSTGRLCPSLKRRFAPSNDDKDKESMTTVSKKANGLFLMNNMYPYGSSPFVNNNNNNTISVLDAVRRQQQILLESARIHSALRFETNFVMNEMIQRHRESNGMKLGSVSPTNSCSQSPVSVEMSDAGA